MYGRGLIKKAFVTIMSDQLYCLAHLKDIFSLPIFIHLLLSTLLYAHFKHSHLLHIISFNLCFFRPPYISLNSSPQSCHTWLKSHKVLWQTVFSSDLYILHKYFILNMLYTVSRVWKWSRKKHQLYCCNSWYIYSVNEIVDFLKKRSCKD